MESVIKEEFKKNSTRLLSEIQNRYILHWNYRSYEEIPMELLDYGGHIEELYLKENGLKDIPEELPFRCPNLTNLYLYSNELTQIHPSIGNMKNLTTLDLSRNKLQELPPEIGSLSSLKNLDLSSNKLKSIPTTIGSLQKLEYFYIVGNHIKEIPRTIKNCQNLVALYGGLNEISKIPIELAECKDLRDLYFNDNKLTSIPEILTIKLKKLETLNLNNNNLEYLPSRTFQSTPPKVSFHDNPRLHHLSFILACQINTAYPISKMNPISTGTFRFANRGCFIPLHENETLKSSDIFSYKKMTSRNGFTHIFKFPSGVHILDKENPIPTLLELSLRISYIITHPHEKRFIEHYGQNYRAYNVLSLFKTHSIDVCLPKILKDKLRTWRSICAHCCLPLFNEMSLSLLKVTFKKELDRQLEEGYCSLHFCSEACRTAFKNSYKHEHIFDF